MITTGRHAGAPLPIVLVRAGTALLTLSALASLLGSPDRAATLPFSALVVAGSAVVWSISSAGRSDARRAAVALWTVLALAYACALILPLIVEWPADKIPGLVPVYRTFPSLLHWAPAWVGTGLSSNQMGGILAACIAFAAALFVPLRTDEGVDRRMRGVRWAAGPLIVLGTPILVAAGSRAALAGLIVAVFAALASVKPRALWVPATIATGACIFVLARPGIVTHVLDRFLHEEPLQTKLLSRMDIWTSAVKGIADHPFAGIGLGTLNEVLPVRYPYGVVGLDYSVTQAHNIVLDTALTMGLLGAAGLVLTLAGALWWGFREPRTPAGGGPAAFGTRAFTAMLVVFTLFGTTDSLGFASASSLLFWVALAGMLWISETEAPRQRGPGRLP